MKMESTSQNQAIKFLQLKKHRILLFCFIASTAVVAVANSFGAESTSAVLAGLSTIFSGSFAVLAIYSVYISKNKKERVLSLLLAIFSTLWFSAEQIWNYNEQLLKIDPFPSVADFMWLAGYGFVFTFLILVIRTFRRVVTKKILVSVIALSFSYLIPSIIATYQSNFGANDFDIALALAYPAADAIILAPSIIGLLIFYKTRENYLWALTVAIIITIIADTVFLFLEVSNSYSGDNLGLILFVWSYLFFAYGMYKQNQLIKKENGRYLEEIKLSFVESENKKRMIHLLFVPLAIGTAVTVFGLSFVEIYQFSNLSTHEMQVVQPALYGSIAAIAILCVVIASIGTKLVSLNGKMSEIRSNVEKDTGRPFDESVIYESDVAAQISQLKEKLDRVEKVGKGTNRAILAVGVVIVSILAFYIYENLNGETQSLGLPSGRFVIEDLKGETIDTWVAWYLVEGEPLHITIVNSKVLPQDKLDAIKDAILSTDSVEIPNQLSVNDLTESGLTYYKGWKGAMEEAAQQETKLYIPRNFEILETDRATGEIVIILSTQRDGDGALGFTRSIADKDQNQILKSFITIFDVEDLENDQLAAIVRHEFGHALGLAHSTDQEDLMYPEFHADHPYISECDVDTIRSLYDDNKANQVTCSN